ncbi:unnamed protein product [Paramecium primaurelia]|uniref:Protein kinase domain-containing protein n=1 Tax=Paramecium primaurelia TaxID=5886 RepID=A0A8S1KE91_PARPR|nr:unnamed protein product [Paramecium primaurelia]
MSVNGTYDYIAPEILISKEYDASVDIWSLGVIFFEVLVGKQFFRLLNLDKIQDYIIISQIQINWIIKAQKNLQNKEVEILNKMIVQRLNIQTDCSLNKSIQRIKINDLVDELENMYNLDISISSLIVENKFLNWEIISEFNGPSVSINQSLSIQNSNKSQIEDIIPKLPELLMQNAKNSYLRNDQVNYIPKSASQSMWINKEEINNHQQCGEYGKNLNKKGKWIAIWKGEQLQNAGGVYDGIQNIKFFDEGKKKGKRKELFHNFRSQAQVYEVCEYINSRRSGIWKYLYKDQEIAQGIYNEFGQKNGKWIELSERFQDKCQIIYDGVYKNCNKVGKWYTMEREIIFNQQFYEVKKGNNNSIKIGSWIELIPVQSLIKIHIIMGQKLEIGKFFGIKMEIMKRSKSQKIGNWIELIDNYKKDRQITFVGQYKNGMKVYKWDTIFKQNQQNEIMQHNLKQQIFKSGGGSYLENLVDCEDSIKIGRWIELSDNFKMDSQIIHVGSYKNKYKVGKWHIFYRKIEKFYNFYYSFYWILSIFNNYYNLKLQKKQSQNYIEGTKKQIA